ncbi:MAG: bifunctional folylpolyglutamate synthase/dihydrofolate synthase [Pedobacter sp.]|nr:MAG: bifunctional folylpolyglutamate synthase/dihydrofolate synthase [Pedobacter sp.]
MTYNQTLDYLYAKLPMFTRVGAVAFKKDLHNVTVMCQQLGNPQNTFKTIHVGGTNGKGSTSHMLAAVLNKAGYKTGLYTSPHLKDFRERIRINGNMISKQFVTEFVGRQKQTIEELSPSFFEVTVAMAFSWFALEKVDVAVIEVGLGGRLDSTNIILPDLSVITNISLDHTNILGETLTAIAAEKAGIIKPGIPVIIGESTKETKDTFVEKAEQTGSEIIFADQQLQLSNFKRSDQFLTVSLSGTKGSILEDLELDLTGSYQLKNIQTVIASLLKLKSIGYKISDQSIYSALKSVKSLTGLQGRWQTINSSPLTICDTAHNIAGITEVVNNLKSMQYKNLHIVLGMVKDKDITGVLKLLPKGANYYFCEPGLERALKAEELANQARQMGLAGDVFSTVQTAYSAAKNAADEDDLIFIGGSTFVVAEVL